MPSFLMSATDAEATATADAMISYIRGDRSRNISWIRNQETTSDFVSTSVRLFALSDSRGPGDKQRAELVSWTSFGDRTKASEIVFLVAAVSKHRSQRRFFRKSQPIFNTYPIRVVEPDVLCQPVLPKLDTTMGNGSFIQLRLDSLQFFKSPHCQRDVI